MSLRLKSPEQFAEKKFPYYDIFQPILQLRREYIHHVAQQDVLEFTLIHAYLSLMSDRQFTACCGKDELLIHQFKQWFRWDTGDITNRGVRHDRLYAPAMYSFAGVHADGCRIHQGYLEQEGKTCKCITMLELSTVVTQLFQSMWQHVTEELVRLVGSHASTAEQAAVVCGMVPATPDTSKLHSLPDTYNYHSLTLLHLKIIAAYWTCLTDRAIQCCDIDMVRRQISGMWWNYDEKTYVVRERFSHWTKDRWVDYVRDQQLSHVSHTSAPCTCATMQEVVHLVDTVNMALTDSLRHLPPIRPMAVCKGCVNDRLFSTWFVRTQTSTTLNRLSVQQRELVRAIFNQHLYSLCHPNHVDEYHSTCRQQVMQLPLTDAYAEWSEAIELVKHNNNTLNQCQTPDDVMQGLKYFAWLPSPEELAPEVMQHAIQCHDVIVSVLRALEMTTAAVDHVNSRAQAVVPTTPTTSPTTHGDTSSDSSAGAEHTSNSVSSDGAAGAVLPTTESLTVLPSATTTTSTTAPSLGKLSKVTEHSAETERVCQWISQCAVPQQLNVGSIREQLGLKHNSGLQGQVWKLVETKLERAYSIKRDRTGNEWVFQRTPRDAGTTDHV